jgi:hypothetical protein
MNLKTTTYSDYEVSLPQKGKHILAQQKADSLIVYQAFNPKIAEYAVNHQAFGGPLYKFSRMSWIKTNFLWMMYRCGWAQKENQQSVLAIEIAKTHFEDILQKAIPSSYDPYYFESKESWKKALIRSNVRLQWDPDHTANGRQLERRAIQLGLRGDTLWQFGKHRIISIEDITDFVLKQFVNLKTDKEKLLVPEESVYEIRNTDLRKTLQMD